MPKPRRKRGRLFRIDWNGHPPLPIYRRKLRRAARIVIRKGGYITSTSDGTHAPGSWHYSKRAIDFGSNDPTNGVEARIQDAIYTKFGARKFKELFGPRSYYVKNGVRFTGVFPGHSDHGHVAF